jgi:hypothetical protein
MPIKILKKTENPMASERFYQQRREALIDSGIPANMIDKFNATPNKLDASRILKKRKEKFKKAENPMADERFNAAFRSRMKKAGLKDSEIGDTRFKAGGLSGGQAKLAAKAPPPDKIDAKDFAVLKAEKAKGRGMGLQDEKIKPGKVMKANKGKMFDGYLSTFDASAEASTPKSQRGVTTIVGVRPGAKIGKGKKRFTSMEAMRTAKGFRTIDGKQETSSQFNKRRMALAVAKKAAKASTFGKIALGIGAAGVAASQYLKSKMKKDEPKKKMGGGMMQKPMGGPMGGMMQRPMGYKHGTKPGAGPLGAAGLRQPTKEKSIDQIIKDQKFPPISVYTEDKKKPQKPFPVPSLYNNNKKPSAR